MGYITKQGLIDAKRLIEVGGHCKGELSTSSGKYCIIGAYLHANPYGEQYKDSVELYNFFNKYAPGRNVVQFNDKQKTTKQNVLDFYDKVIQEVEA